MSTGCHLHRSTLRSPLQRACFVWSVLYQPRRRSFACSWKGIWCHLTIDYVGELGLCSRLTKEVNLEFLSACAWVQRLPAVKRAGTCCISNIVVHWKGHRGNVWKLCPFHRKKSQRLLKKNNTLLPVSAKGDKFAERLNPWLQMWSYIRQEIII